MDVGLYIYRCFLILYIILYCSSQEVPVTALSDILGELGKTCVNDSQMEFLVRREYVLDDVLRTIQWPTFSVHSRVMVRMSLFCFFSLVLIAILVIRLNFWKSR